MINNPTIIEQELEKTMWNLMTEIERLKQENMELKTKYVLHNGADNINEGGYTENEYDELAKAYADFGY